ncbi:MAG: peptide-methionine (R)-S-oxide reductase MsrB [Flavobacteriales bacterium]|nr:peptide-methionine (R)-S-oxide reductase MsrB [Flavobacteriia bacterium]NCP06322.1 peptide-methionine (R)-S-oxide reductase MsrB [Flavobacteriales bacterium]PIV94323.1 MAG: peptide-methionine (R)-S-oxide reductase [Flavobacteriaceae bacterium CG17_big_fil_post_rev_8_21_14_2_50_33_15]PIY13241.1 MAG: peptide-methionine (R)-S-oxide reductase [Flavobacteriaceae bacterium CG_4_10_14_3_um_filter_33_47]PJB18626.1 MAG: peptide-methionine (R)-S-oxide reductase [Flavobacteriaceae bacterium CG_4_9_14_3
MKKIILLVFLASMFNCNGIAQKKNNEQTTSFKVAKTNEEWKKQLTPEQYAVLRQQGTEIRFSSSLNKNNQEGIYVCAACNTPLFKSEDKYDSGSGWPSFDREIKGNVAFSSGSDYYYGIEEHCAVCGGHLGHVFNDGPKKTTGLRHCINGVALKFIPKNE